MEDALCKELEQRPGRVGQLPLEVLKDPSLKHRALETLVGGALALLKPEGSVEDPKAWGEVWASLKGHEVAFWSDDRERLVFNLHAQARLSLIASIVGRKPDPEALALLGPYLASPGAYPLYREGLDPAPIRMLWSPELAPYVAATPFSHTLAQMAQDLPSALKLRAKESARVAGMWET